MKKVLICKESDALETRVAMVPADIKKLIGMGFSFKIVSGAGIKSGLAESNFFYIKSFLLQNFISILAQSP